MDSIDASFSDGCLFKNEFGIQIWTSQKMKESDHFAQFFNTKTGLLSMSQPAFIIGLSDPDNPQTQSTFPVVSLDENTRYILFSNDGEIWVSDPKKYSWNKLRNSSVLSLDERSSLEPYRNHLHLDIQKRVQVMWSILHNEPIPDYVPGARVGSEFQADIPALQNCIDDEPSHEELEQPNIFGVKKFFFNDRNEIDYRKRFEINFKFNINIDKNIDTILNMNSNKKENGLKLKTQIKAEVQNFGGVIRHPTKMEPLKRLLWKNNRFMTTFSFPTSNFSSTAKQTADKVHPNLRVEAFKTESDIFLRRLFRNPLPNFEFDLN